MSEKSRSELKGEAIIEAAIVEFLQSGYDGASMDRVAKKASVSKATIYKHFGSKKELFIAIMLQFTEVLNSAHQITYTPTTPIKDQLTQFAKHKMEFLTNEEYMTVMKLGINILMNESEVTQLLKGEIKDLIFENLVAWFEAAKSDGKLKIDSPEFVATQFFGSIKAHAFCPQIMMGAPMPDKMMQEIIVDRSVEAILSQYGV